MPRVADVHRGPPVASVAAVRRAAALPVAGGTVIPRKWPKQRYDVIWSFTLIPGLGPVSYAFSQIPQKLLAGDDGTVIG